MAFLEAVDVEVEGRIRTIHLVCDNVSRSHFKIRLAHATLWV
jgi:hypothetical protein